MISPADLKEPLEVLFWQEATCYRTDDYIEMMKLHPCLDATMSAHHVEVKKAASEPDANDHLIGIADDAGPAVDPISSSSIDQQPKPQGLIKEQWRDVMCEWAYNCKLEMWS